MDLKIEDVVEVSIRSDRNTISSCSFLNFHTRGGGGGRDLVSWWVWFTRGLASLANWVDVGREFMKVSADHE